MYIYNQILVFIPNWLTYKTFLQLPPSFYLFSYQIDWPIKHSFTSLWRSCTQLQAIQAAIVPHLTCRAWVNQSYRMFLSFMTKAPGSNTYGFAQSSFAVCKLYFAQNSFIHLCPILGQSTFVTIWISITTFRSRPISIVLFRCAKIKSDTSTHLGVSFPGTKKLTKRWYYCEKEGKVYLSVT